MLTLRTRLATGLTVIACLAFAASAGSAGASPLKGRPRARSASASTPAQVSRRQRSREQRAHRAAAQAAIAATLARPCTNTELLPNAEDTAAVSGAVLCLVNQERAKHDVPALSSNPDLRQAAEEHAQELVADDYFAHVTPSGYTPVDRIRATGYIPGTDVGYVIGENLAWGTLNLSTPAAIVDAWIASPGHLANILEPRYKETGIGITARVPSSLGNGQAGGLYAQEFGVIVH